MPVLAILGAVFLWGGSFIATKAAVAAVPPIAFAVLRFSVACGVLMGIALVTRTPLAIPRADWARVVAAGLLGTTATYVLENVALTLTTAGNSALILAVGPLLGVLGAVAFLGERVTWRKAAGAALAFGGVLALVGVTVGRAGLGDALMALNALVGATFGVVSKPLADRRRPLAYLTATFAVGVVGLLPCAALEAFVGHPAWHPVASTFGALAYLGLGSSCVAYWLWMYAMGHLEASTVGLFIYLMPVVTLVLSAMMLGESLTPGRLLEATLVLAGVALASMEPRVRSAFAEAR